MRAFVAGIAVACLAALGTVFLYQGFSISAVDYRADRATHVHPEKVNSEMGEQTRAALSRRSREAPSR